MAESNSSELKPCPFCGKTDYYIEQLDSCSSVVICQGMVDEYSACLARGPVAIQDDDGEEQPGRDAAIREWNARLPETTLLTRIAELELLADDARGKRCPECSAPMVSLSTIDGGQRVCSGCDKVWSWHLKEGQPPLIGNNRMVKKV